MKHFPVCWVLALVFSAGAASEETPVPSTTIAGPALRFDWSAIEVGVASYEAGPTGYGLARACEAAGIACLVAAPSRIARASGDRVKTDRRDAERLVRLLRVGDLHAVRVPSLVEEAARELRYEALRGLMASGVVDVVATALFSFAMSAVATRALVAVSVSVAEPMK